MKCSQCGHNNGHNLRTCIHSNNNNNHLHGNKGSLKLFGVKILMEKEFEAMKKSLSIGNLNSSSSSSSHFAEQLHADGYLSDGPVHNARRKGLPSPAPTLILYIAGLFLFHFFSCFDCNNYQAYFDEFFFFFLRLLMFCAFGIWVWNLSYFSSCLSGENIYDSILNRPFFFIKMFVWIRLETNFWLWHRKLKYKLLVLNQQGLVQFLFVVICDRW